MFQKFRDISCYESFSFCMIYWRVYLSHFSCTLLLLPVGIRFLNFWLVLSFGNASLVSIASISVDRFLMVVYPLKYRYMINRTVTIFWLSGIWLSGSALPMLRLVYGRKWTRLQSTVLVWLLVYFLLLCTLLHIQH